MKRSVSVSASAPTGDAETTTTDQAPKRRRQPQISCNFCRSKKLKCDRGSPCSNCASRGIPCDGQSVPLPLSSSNRSSSSAFVGSGPLNGSDILERLRRLEDAVFGHSPASDQDHSHNHNNNNHAASHKPLPPPSSDDTLTPSSLRLALERPSELDYTNYSESLALDDCDNFTFRVANSGEHTSHRSASTRCIDLPNREDALALFEDYLDNSDFHVANVLHPPSAKAKVSDVYTQLRQGRKVALGSAAFILSFCAVSAFFWDCDYSSNFSFPSEDSAAAQSHTWRRAAWDLLDQAQRSATNTLDVIQARLILGDLIYNMEGTTSRYRYIHSTARAAAYEAKLHITDLPGNEPNDGPLEQETKRRVWWFLAATDWLMCSMGGNVDRVYNVNPKHMVVNYPRHFVASDRFDPAYGPWSEASVIHMNVRIRLAETARECADALPLGSGDIDTLPYAKIASLDRQYEQLLADWPPAYENFTSTDVATRKIAFQRCVGILSIHARRARLLRPLLQIKGMPEKFQVFRKNCLASAEAVIDFASTVLSETVDTPSSSSTTATAVAMQLYKGMNSQRSPNRSALVINHLFMACAVLATDPSLRGGGEGATPVLDADTERRRSQLANACRLLEKAGEKSPIALGMMKRLVAVLRKHHVHGVEGHRYVSQQPAAADVVRSRALSTAAEVPTSQQQQHQQQQQQQHQQQTTPDIQNIVEDPSGFTMGQQQQQQALAAQNWAYGAMDPSGVSGIWNDFLGTNPGDNGWEQLFADLDYLNSSI